MSKETETIKKRPRNHIFRVIGDKFEEDGNAQLLPQRKFHFFTLSRYQGTVSNGRRTIDK